MKYKIGEILTSNREVVVERALSGDKVVIPEGTKVIIGADRMAHHIKNGCIQPLTTGTEVSGYDSDGIAEFIYLWMSTQLPINEIETDWDLGENTIKDIIAEALEEIGL